MTPSNKKTNICLVPKKRDLSLASNYRPISLLNSKSEVFKNIFKHQYNHLEGNNNYVIVFQSGFIPGDSTVNQLTYLYHSFC